MQSATVWSRVLEGLKPHIGADVLDMWFKPSALEHIKGGDVCISVPNRFFREWIKDHYYDLLRAALEKELSEPVIRISFSTQEGRIQEEKKGTAGAAVVEKKKSNIDGRYTFDRFVVGSGNQFAHAASRKVAERPGLSYNPLFIYSGVGLGKTHLLGAIGNFILSNTKLSHVSYFSAEHFTNDVIHSIRHDKMAHLRNLYRNVDVLLIDDIQFLSGKERTQEEFFHTFNTLYEANKQVVLTSDRSTKEIADIEDRLRSRFEMGLIADIQPPDLETRIAILYKRAETEGLSLSDEVALFVATHINTNIRELEGSLIRLGAFSSLVGEEMTVEMAKNVLKDVLRKTERSVTVDNIQKKIAERFQVRMSDIKSSKRSRNLVHPRHIGMYITRELTGLSFPEIGLLFGGKDHSTVIHACKQIEKERSHNLNLKATIDSLILDLKENA